MATPGANIKYGKQSFLWEMLLRKMGFKPRSVKVSLPTGRYDCTADDGTNFPRQIALCRKYNTTTAPTTNTAADAPSGKGDICLHVKAAYAGLAHMDPSGIDVYRCTAYTNSTTFTWAQIL